MTNSKNLEALIQLIKNSGNASKALTEIHNLFVHNIDLSILTRKEQNHLFVINEMAAAVAAIEEDIKAA